MRAKAEGRKGERNEGRGRKDGVRGRERRRMGGRVRYLGIQTDSKGRRE